MELKALALSGVGTFAVSSAFAEDKACCAGTAASHMKSGCSATFANLNLTPAQQTKMEKLAAECDKGGCNERTMAKMEKGARGVLSHEQFVAWKAACTARMSAPTQS